MNWQILSERAHVPYSVKNEAAVVLGESGKSYSGVRVENVSFPLTMDAVQLALFNCLSEGDEPQKLILPPEQEEDSMLAYWISEFKLEAEKREDIQDLHFADLLHSVPEKQRVLHQQLQQNSRVIHSDFPVSAILYCPGGVITGTNIEVSSWSLGLCAERVALGKAISAGITEFSMISLHSRHGDYSTPCGACRQVMSELLPYHPVHLLHNDGTRSEILSVDLLPYHFKSEYLTERNS